MDRRERAYAVRAVQRAGMFGKPPSHRARSKNVIFGIIASFWRTGRKRARRGLR